MDQDAIRDISGRFQAMMAQRQSTANARAAPSPRAVASPETTPEYGQLMSLSRHPLSYEAPGLLDEALNVMDLEKLYADADVTSELDDTLGYQDHLIKALLKWFKQDFFQWINSPTCSACGSETEGIGGSHPSPDEARLGASRTELHRCKANASHIERFPRYDGNPRTLLTWRKGRCGEFANCFTLLCMALGSRARWVFNYEDHVWTEVFSTTLNRWIHCDACENAWDAPQMYAVGWGKKMSHCVAFSSSGAQDVSRRYIREDSQRLSPKVPADVMAAALRDINRRARAAASWEEGEQYCREDAEEELELKSYVKAPEPTKAQEVVPRESGSASWKEARGESGK